MLDKLTFFMYSPKWKRKKKADQVSQLPNFTACITWLSSSSLGFGYKDDEKTPSRSFFHLIKQVNQMIFIVITLF